MLQRELTAVRSDPLGVLTQGTATTDKVFFWCTRCVLNIKSTTSNMIVVGKIRHIPLSISCHITVICYTNMLHNLPQYMIVNTLRPEQYGCRCAGDILKCIFINEIMWILKSISLLYNEVVGGYIGFSPSVCPSVRPSVRPSVCSACCVRSVTSTVLNGFFPY